MAARTAAPTLSIVSLGCPKNQVDAEAMAASFLGSGCTYTADTALADIVLVNTCGFIESAKVESIDAILSYLKLKAERPDLKVIVGGCLFERYREELEREMPEVDGWLAQPGPAGVRALLGKLGYRVPLEAPSPSPAYGRPFLLNEPGIAYLKIAEGCDRPCSFCAIPAIKGRLRSRPIASLVQEARDLAVRLGVREVNLVAQDPASYGKDLGDGTDLLALLRALDEVEEVAWFRLLYMFPFGLDERHLEVLAASKRFCPYLDMPLQHSHRDVLQAMRRPGDGERYLAHLKTIRERWPGVTLRTTFLVGHPGETEAHFQDLCRFVEQARVQWAGVFEYSPEEGTHAATLEHRVAKRTAARRAERLRELAEEARDLTPFRLGEIRQALVVELGEGFVSCRTASEAPEVDGCVLTPPHREARPGEFVRVRVDRSDGFDFTGEIVAVGQVDGRVPAGKPSDSRRRREGGPARAAA